MVFCNEVENLYKHALDEVTILILIDGFLQYIKQDVVTKTLKKVTILILIDGFLQSDNSDELLDFLKSQSLF